MIANSMGDLIVLPHRGRVITAHHALLARELDDGVGHQVCLAQVRGASSVGGKMGAQVSLAGDSERELLDALGLGEHATELLLEGNLGQTLTELVEGDLQVFLVEELSVVQTARTTRSLPSITRSAFSGLLLETTTNSRVSLPSPS